MKHWLLTLVLMTPGLSLAADWVIQNQDSRVSFITIKQGNIAEVSRFTKVSGALSSEGKFSLTIPLTGVQTGIDIRNERMQSMLFEVGKFPELELNADVDMAAINSIKAGDQAVVQVIAKVTLHGKSQPMTFDVMVARLNNNILTVSSFQPIVVNAGQFALSAGVEKLRQVAGLKAISEAVPVSFVITLSSKT